MDSSKVANSEDKNILKCLSNEILSAEEYKNAEESVEEFLEALFSKSGTKTSTQEPQKRGQSDAKITSWYTHYNHNYLLSYFSYTAVMRPNNYF